MKFETFLVGGAVRDDLLGRDCSDRDFLVMAPDFDAMLAEVEASGATVLDGTVLPEFRTLKAKDNEGAFGPAGLVVDFVLARRDSAGGDGRRPESTEAGTLLDDLARRDFTCNALARNVETGEMVDPFGGMTDMANGVLRAVGVPRDRFMEDALRVMRGFRFGVTLGFRVEDATAEAMTDPDVLALLSGNRPVSLERKRTELDKAFRADARETMRRLADLPEDLTRAFGLGEGLRVTATMKG